MDTSLHISHTQSISTSTAEQLSCITSEFYAQQAQSFSATRQAPWQGWQKCLEAMPQLLAGEKPSVLDIGCGNQSLFGFDLKCSYRASVFFTDIRTF